MLLMKSQCEACHKRLDVQDPSATPRKRLKKLFDGKYTSHHLRHTIRVNGTANNVSHLALQTICGWSDGAINKQMLKYGKAGLADSSEVLKATYEASLKIHKHLRHLEPITSPKVVKIR